MSERVVIGDADARERVVHAADRLFYARGVQSVGMDAVRAEAGLPLKRIYALFPSKDDLVLAVLADRSRVWDAGIADAARAAGDDAEARLLAIFDFLASWFCDDDFRGCAFINSFGELGGGSPAVASAVREQKASFQRYVAELVAEAGGDAELAAQLAILAEGAQTTAAISAAPEAALQARRAAEVLIGVRLRAQPQPA